MGLRLIIATAWALPLMAIVGLLYYDFVGIHRNGPETNRAMRTRMCREHVDLARLEPANDQARVAVEECVGSGYITHAEGITAID